MFFLSKKCCNTSERYPGTEILIIYGIHSEFELNFKKSAEENLAAIRAIHPWNKAYFFHNITAIAPNPFSTYVEDNPSNYSTAGTIVEVDSKTKTISVLCQDGKVLKMENVTLYKKWDRPFTKNYISREIKIGSLI